MQLHHLALGAQDVRRIADFYVAAFGLPELKQHHDEKGALRSVWLDLGGSVLMIEKTLAPPHQVSGVGAGLFLLAFRIEEGERRAVENQLLALGAPVESSTSATLYARDPEGNRIAISHYPL